MTISFDGFGLQIGTITAGEFEGQFDIDPSTGDIETIYLDGFKGRHRAVQILEFGQPFFADFAVGLRVAYDEAIRLAMIEHRLLEPATKADRDRDDRMGEWL